MGGQRLIGLLNLAEWSAGSFLLSHFLLLRWVFVGKELVVVVASDGPVEGVCTVVVLPTHRFFVDPARLVPIP